MAVSEATAVTTVTRPGRPRRANWIRRHSFELILITPLVAYILVLTVANCKIE